MRKFRFLLIAIALVGISSFYACGGASDKETNKDTTQVSDEPQTPEEGADTVAK